MLLNYINSMVIGRIIIITSVLLLFNSKLINAQEDNTFPASKVGELAKSYFEIFNAGDTVAMKEFITTKRTASALERLSVVSRLGQYQQMLGMLKSLDPKVIDELNTEEISVKAFSNAINTWFDIGFKITTDSPPKLESLSIRPGEAPSSEGWDMLEQLLEEQKNR